jgi:hypothetical protein
MVDANRSNWDSRVPVHLESAFYDVAGFIERHQPRLDAVEREEVGDVAGKSLLHLQCHIGIDTISWALLGATGWRLTPWRSSLTTTCIRVHGRCRPYGGAQSCKHVLI